LIGIDIIVKILFVYVTSVIYTGFRVFLERILYDTMMEIRQSGTFQALTDAVQKEKEEKSNMEDIIRK